MLPSSGWWKEAVRLKIVRPCWTAVTRRVVNDRPSRTRSTWYTIGTPGMPGPQEVRVQRVHRALAVGGAAGRDQRLARDLPAEDPLQGLLRAAAAEDVDLDLLQVEQIDQALGRVRHRVRSPVFPVLTAGRRR